MSGPLDGLLVVELAGLGPAPFACMVLADLGAEVVRVDRVGAPPIDPATAAYDVLSRNRPTIGVDLKSDDGREVVVALAARADAFVEGFRPGVAERLGLGPGELCAANERLVYGRMTGWGQSGPSADRAGHDLTYASVAGAIAHIGRHGQPPTPPLNLVADFGGGSMLLVAGILAALVERAASGVGQVVDAAMVDGVSMLMAPFFGAFSMDVFSGPRGTNMLDSGAPYYDCYRCSDGGYVAIGAIEPQFFAELLVGLGLPSSWLDRQNDQAAWPELRDAIASVIASRPRAEWTEHFGDTDACVAPVLPLLESATHPQIAARSTVIEVDGVPQHRPAPRFSRSASGDPRVGRAAVGDDAESLLTGHGVSSEVIGRARASGALV